MKRLKASERKKKRYIGFFIHSEGEVDSKEFLREFFKVMRDFFGENLCSEMNPVLIYFKRNIGIIRCEHRYVDYIKVGLLLINKIGDRRVLCSTVGVSGTIKSLKSKYLNKIKFAH